MIPDFPDIKNNAREKMTWWAQKVSQYQIGILHEIPRGKSFEGDQLATERPSGTREETEFEKITSDITIKQSEIPDKSLPAMFDKLLSVAGDIAQQQFQRMIEEVHRATEETGNVVDAGDRDFGPEIILDALEEVEATFDEEGNMRKPTLVVRPELGEKIEEHKEEWENDPEIQKRLREIKQDKRKEWHGRESNRKLVG